MTNLAESSPQIRINFALEYRLQIVLLKLISFPVGKKISTRYLNDKLSRQARHLAKTPCRCAKDVLKANLKASFARNLEDTFVRNIADVSQN